MNLKRLYILWPEFIRYNFHEYHVQFAKMQFTVSNKKKKEKVYINY